MIAEDRSMDTPQISRSGRVLKKSAKVKEMEDFDINELDVQGKPRKKSKLMDEFEDYDDKRVAPIKIPKISLNVQGGVKRKMEMSPGIGRISFQTAIKGKQDVRRSVCEDSSDASKESDSSSASSESSSSSASSSDVSDEEDNFASNARPEKKFNIAPRYQHMPIQHDKMVVDHQFGTFEQSSGATSDDSEDVTTDSALVIAEDSDDESTYNRRMQKGTLKKRTIKKDPSYAPKQAGAQRKKVIKPSPKKKKTQQQPPKPKTLSAYMLWCSENRKRILASSGNIGPGNMAKKLGEAWQALPEKEKMAWRTKAKRLAVKNSGNIISTGPLNSLNKSLARSPTNDDPLKSIGDSCGTLGTAPIDTAAHLKLLGDSLTVIGERLIEHEGQLAVSGIYSVLLDTLLCAVSPLLCLTQAVPGLDSVPPEVFRKTLDHIAYFMPGL